LQFVADRAAEHMIDRLLPQPSQQIPQSEIDPRNRVHDQAFAPVILRGEVHLIPDDFDVGRVAALKETREMLLDQIASGLAAGRHRETDRAVLGLDLHHQGAEHVDPEAAARGAIFGIFSHRRRDMVVDPVALRPVVIVGAAAAHDARSYLFDAGEGHA
jgi:hypothetical protein